MSQRGGDGLSNSPTTMMQTLPRRSSFVRLPQRSKSTRTRNTGSKYTRTIHPAGLKRFRQDYAEHLFDDDRKKKAKPKRIGATTVNLNN